MKKNLNYEQNKAVSHQGHLAVLACPGSGKTHTIVQRAKRILEEKDAVLALVTFTNVAANEMRDRLGKDSAKQVLGGTFHKMAKLQQEMTGVKVRMLSAGDKMMFAKRAAEMVGNEGMDPRSIRAIIDTHHNNISHDGLEGTDLFNAYESLRSKSDLKDFQEYGDLVPKAITGMKQGTIKPLAITHLLIDEFQDIDPVQLAWVKAHIDIGIEVTVVLDDDQSIFGFRDAMGYSSLKEFVSYSHAKEIILSTCYRCHQEIIDSAYNLISKNTQRIEKQIHSHKGTGGSVELQTYNHETEELNAITKTLTDDDPSTWAILVRNRNQIKLIEKTLTEANIVFTTLGDSENMWDQDSVAVYMGLLRSLLYQDSHGIEQALSWSGLSEIHICKIVTLIENSLKQNNRLPDNINQSRHYQSLSDQYNQWQTVLDQQSPVANELVLHGIKDWMESRTKSDLSTKSINRVTEIFCETAGRTLAKRLSYIEKMQRIKYTTDILMRGVAISTLHSAKGLEWQNVWMPFVNEGVFPHKLTQGPAALAEERRVAFVGMTRAIGKLVLSANTFTQSQFIHQIGLTPTEDQTPTPFMDRSVLG